ncbi:SDR family NAD(P)-dependent oxidoreductase, partial [Chloroflexota bacterium]
VRLEGKVAIVTGAGQGIGKEIALTFNREGAKIVIVDVVQESIDEVVREVEGAGRKAVGVRADVSSSKEVGLAIEEALRRLGSIDILVNNAGIWPVSPLAELEEEQWDSVMSINLKGTFNCTKAVLPTMLAQKSGNIINIASIGGTVMGCPVMAPHVDYAASKAGQLGFTKAAALELASQGIRVNAIAPGSIMTLGAITGSIPEDKRREGLAEEDMAKSGKLIERFGRTVPLGRVGEPKDIANIALFLASEDSSYVTGQMIVADGGFSLQ